MYFFCCKPLHTAIYVHPETQSNLCLTCYNDAPQIIKYRFTEKRFVSHSVIYGLTYTFDKCVKCDIYLFNVKYYDQCTLCATAITSMLINGEHLPQ